jgi:hypothetical protein
VGYFRFQKRIGIGSFGRINISKSGISLSEGVRGFHVTFGKTPRLTVGLPGSGLSYTTTPPRGRGRSSASSLATLVIATPIALLIAWAILAWIASLGG